MDEQLKYPDMDAAASIFRKLGVDPNTRFSSGDQDFEYTSCELSEIEDYIGLYIAPDTSDKEKRVLGCFLLECLNEYVSTNASGYPKHSEIMELLHTDSKVHESELEYWTNTEDPEKENWWPITEYILEWRST